MTIPCSISGHPCPRMAPQSPDYSLSTLAVFCPPQQAISSPNRLGSHNAMRVVLWYVYPDFVQAETASQHAGCHATAFSLLLFMAQWCALAPGLRNTAFKCDTYLLRNFNQLIFSNAKLVSPRGKNIWWQNLSPVLGKGGRETLGHEDTSRFPKNPCYVSYP